MNQTCDFCNDGVTKATHIITTADGARTIPVCRSCMTAFIWGQVERKAEVTRIPEGGNGEDGRLAVEVFFQDDKSAVIHVRQGEDIEDEVAKWCNWHGVPYDSVADFAVQGGGEQL